MIGNSFQILCKLCKKCEKCEGRHFFLRFRNAEIESKSHFFVIPSVFLKNKIGDGTWASVSTRERRNTRGRRNARHAHRQ